MEELCIAHLVKDYGDNKGVFDISLHINKGEIYGYLGPNGAGKSTTIRHLMGFIKPNQGTAKIRNKDCWSEQKEIQKTLGYLPGEIAFPNDMNGNQYIKMIANMRGMKDMKYANELLALFEINPDMNLKRMSKGMKQKIGIVTAFMHDPQIILLDEPTSGLDPLMQNRFLELLEKEKKKNKTILMSSHIFEEVEKTCDRIGMIKDGKIIDEISAKELKHSRLKTYKVEFIEEASMKFMKESYPNGEYTDNLQATIAVSDEEINNFIQVLSNCKIAYLKEEKHSLEDYFMKYYGGK